jgi:hypothetical protein
MKAVAMATLVVQSFLHGALVDARLQAREGGREGAERGLLASGTYEWHKAAVRSLQSPKKNTDYQYFGNAISADQNLVIIGAPGDNVMNFFGSVCVYETVTWELVDFLEPDDAAKGDAFGSAVAISGYDALIGAHK